MLMRRDMIFFIKIIADKEMDAVANPESHY